MKIKVFTAFSGYDSQCLALDRLHKDFPEFEYELVGWSEIDKYAIRAHNALYPEAADLNWGDIATIDWTQVPDFDLFTYSFPCTNISQCGLQKGLAKHSGTQSSLLWECCQAIEAKHPQYLVMENVKALVSKKFKPDFDNWVEWLEDQGYNNFWQVLNAKNYGVPQNRERVFMVSIHNKDAQYTFPEPFKLEKCIGDYMEENVPEQYIVSRQHTLNIITHCERKVAEGCGFKTNFTPPQWDSVNNNNKTRSTPN